MPKSLVSLCIRNLRILVLVLALSVGVSCTTGETPLGTDTPAVGDGTPSTPPPGGGTVPPSDSSTGTPPDSGTATPPDSGSGTPGDSTVPPADSTPDKGTLLMCLVQDYDVTTAVIGPQGGLIQVGSHILKIHEGALLQDVTITAEQIEGPESSVRLSPEGLQFAVPAELFLSYQNCPTVQRLKHVVYTDELLNILERTPSLDMPDNSQVMGLIWHFSRYAVAF